MQSVQTSYFLKYPFVAKIFPSGVTFSDSRYNLPTQDFLLKKFYPYFSAELERLGIVEWSDKFDCEDFAATYKMLCQACHKNSRSTQEGLAVGAIDYAKDNGEYHCINIAFTDKGLLFIEPQTGKLLTLSKSEQNSINRVRL